MGNKPLAVQYSRDQSANNENLKMKLEVPVPKDLRYQKRQLYPANYGEPTSMISNSIVQFPFFKISF